MEYTPAPIGVEVRGIDLKQPVPENIVEQIKKDVHKHRLLIFKDQGVISADRHVEISQWFGELESTFYKHPKSPHPDVFRVSNNEVEGCTNVGRTGWHIDGSFMEKPFSFALYHMVSVPKIGNTGKIYFCSWQGGGGGGGGALVGAVCVCVVKIWPVIYQQVYQLLGALFLYIYVW